MRILSVALAGVLIAGCIADPAGPAPEPSGDRALKPMAFDVTQAVDWWEHISTEYPKHDSFTPANDLLREFLVGELETIGMEVEVRSYAVTPGVLGTGQNLPDEGMTPVTEVNAVIATRPGTWIATHPEGPDRRIGMVSHYDTQAATIHGAYDDKSGVAAQFHVCKAFTQVPMNKTLTCIFFDAEEQGLIASKRYVEDIADETDAYVYDFVIGYDMTGINWPGHDWKMYVMTGDADHVPRLKPFAQEVLHGQLQYPMEGVEVLDTHDRNSDERRFKEAGIPIYRFAGGRHASDYPQYHGPLDTVDYVYDFVGGRGNFEAGFHSIVEGSYHLILALDGTDIDGLAARYG